MTPGETCHELVPPGVACIEGTCMHTIDAADCYFDGAPMRVGDWLPDTDDLNACYCNAESAPEVGCTLLL